MTDQAQGEWHDWEAKPLVAPAESFNTLTPITEQNKMNDLEDADMIRSLVSRIGDYLVERTKLAERVKEAEATISQLQAAVREADEIQHAQVKEILACKDTIRNLEGRLDHEQTTVSQLVSERDNVKAELQATADQLAGARREIEYYVGEAQRLEKERNEATHAADVCREQREQMAGQVSALKAAFAALRVLE